MSRGNMTKGRAPRCCARTYAQLGALAGVEAGAPLVVSCYLDVDGRGRPRHGDVMAAAEQVARGARAQAGHLRLDRDGRAAVDAAVAGFTRRAGDLVERGDTRGLALFSCVPLGLDEEVRAPVALPDQAVIGTRPWLLPLAAALDDRPPVGLVLTDRAHARLALYHLGELEELPEVHDDVPPQTSGGGWSQGRLARHADEAAHHHAKRVAEAAYQSFRDVAGLELVLAGPEAAVRDTAACLRPELAVRLVAELRLPLVASTGELVEALGAVERERVAARRDAVASRIRDEAGSPSVAAGPGAVLEALRQGRVGTAVAAEGSRAPGTRCPRCATLTLAPACPLCGAATEPLEDVVEPALEAALRQGATVLRVPPDGALDPVGGVGALLRF